MSYSAERARVSRHGEGRWDLGFPSAIMAGYDLQGFNRRPDWWLRFPFAIGFDLKSNEAAAVLLRKGLELLGNRVHSVVACFRESKVDDVLREEVVVAQAAGRAMDIQGFVGLHILGGELEQFAAVRASQQDEAVVVARYLISKRVSSKRPPLVRCIRFAFYFANWKSLQLRGCVLRSIPMRLRGVDRGAADA